MNLEKQVTFGALGLLTLITGIALHLFLPKPNEAAEAPQTEITEDLGEAIVETDLLKKEKTITDDIEKLLNELETSAALEVPETLKLLDLETSEDRYFVARSADECTKINYLCESGWDAFSTSNGCGCEIADVKPIEPDEPRTMPKPLVRPNEREKYYVGDVEQCRIIKYQCPSGWEHFSDEKGCGCQTVLEKTIPQTPKPEVYPEASNSWGSYLNPKDEAPLNAWQAYYINTDNPKKIVKTETVDRLSVNYAWSDLGIQSEKFGGYWVGEWEFKEDTTWEIGIAQGWSKTRLIIDGKLIYEGSDRHTINYEFKAGKHRVEVEYLNQWHTVEFVVHMGEPVNRIKSQEIDWWLEQGQNRDWPITLVSVYESANFDTRIPLLFVEDNEESLLVLSSYSSVEWNIDSWPTWVKGVLVASYEDSSRVTGVPPEIPVVYVDDYLSLPFDLEPSCTNHASFTHCEDKGLIEIDRTLEPIFGKTPKFFAGKYGADKLLVPEFEITEQLRSKINQDHQDWQDEVEKKKNTKQSFEGLFD